jgi:hypothetical protein
VPAGPPRAARYGRLARVGSAFAKTINDLDEAAFQALYGPWDPPEPAQVAALLAGSGVRWWIAGGRAARAGAPARRHGDTDIAVRLDPAARAWLAGTLDLLGHRDWAATARAGG